MELLAYPLLAILFVAVFTREVIAPASRNACSRRWLILSSCIGAASIVTAVGVGYLLEAQLQRFALFPGIGRGPDLAVGLLSFLLTSFVFYWWHRAIHHFDTLWRMHQLHHSAARIEALTAFYAHPLDTAGAVILSAFSSYLVLGASPVAAAIGLALTGAVDIYLHADIRTPRWVGYLVQRPEMHTVHHRHGHHAQNYGLPVWDLLFGTWCNPAEREQRCGFDDDKAVRIADMLLLRDVHRTAATGTAGEAPAS
jgi:sterol desaturase/sphingolipid hydroxylase (fatty acid hydroxylase superfamily)